MSRQQSDERVSKLQTLKAGALYFALVFGAGFVLGTVRTLWIVRTLGASKAELIEAPIMFVVIVLSARWMARRFTIPPLSLRRLAIGLVALGLLLLAEFTVVHWIIGLTIAQYLTGWDPVAGTVLVVMFAILALVPHLVDKIGRDVTSLIISTGVDPTAPPRRVGEYYRGERFHPSVITITSCG